MVTVVGGGGSYYSGTAMDGSASTAKTMFFPTLDATKTIPIYPGIGGAVSSWTLGTQGGET